MKKNAFTMIELIFVIVIIGILVTIITPKIMATKWDAKVNALAKEVTMVPQEIQSYVTAYGRYENNLSLMSNALVSLDKKGFIVYYTSNGQVKPKVTFMTNFYAIDGSGLAKCFLFSIIKKDGKTILSITKHRGGSGIVCDRIRPKVTEGNITLLGGKVKF